MFIESLPYTTCGPELAPGEAMPDFELWQYSHGVAHLINRERTKSFFSVAQGRSLVRYRIAMHSDERHHPNDITSKCPGEALELNPKAE